MDRNKLLLPYMSEGKAYIESIWVKVLDDTTVEVDNIPFFAPNLALGDIVRVEKTADGNYFESLIEESGHSCLQVVLLIENENKEFENDIEGLDCNWEQSHISTRYSIDVPSHLNYKLVQMAMVNWKSNDRLDFKEACLSKKHREDLL